MGYSLDVISDCAVGGPADGYLSEYCVYGYTRQLGGGKFVRNLTHLLLAGYRDGVF